MAEGNNRPGARGTCSLGEYEMKQDLEALGVLSSEFSDGGLRVTSPIDGSELGRVGIDDAASIDAKVAAAGEAYQVWRTVPAPRRGELIRLFAEELRENKDTLGRIVTRETGKILTEGRGEVQEMIDICDFAVGLSRQLYGLTIASERPGHRIMELWHPLGAIGVITAFNFPVAVWAWNFALAAVCGNAVIWKPSEKTPLCALATRALFEKALRRFGDAPEGLLHIVNGAREAGEHLADHRGLPLISATGSSRMGGQVGPRVAARFGRVLLELGGNNAMVLTPAANLDLAVRAIVFAAVGTAGQRCTSQRRLIVHADVHDTLVPRLKAAYERINVGNPMEEGVLLGPLIDKSAFDNLQRALDRIRQDGGQVFGGERLLADTHPDAYYVRPAIAEMPRQTGIVRTETFAPLLYVLKYTELDEAIAIQNDVPQGLSSCIFTTDLREAERFISAAGSDCGIANVNIGPSGAEIGGAFGGEKETGGGREAGSDAWKNYMRRMTSTVNYTDELPLAQGVEFDAA